MKTHIKLAIALCLAGTAVSCTDELTEKVFSSLTQASYNYTEADFGPTITAPYNYLRMVRHDHFWATNEFSGDQIVNPPNISGWDDGGVFRALHYHTWTAEHGWIRNGWDNFYSGIVLCNTILEQIESDQVPAPSEAAKAAGLAEVRALRAYYYWLLCDNFGDVPLVTEVTAELPAKSTRKEVFDFIESELLDVIPQLSEEQGGKMYGRMNKWAAHTTLANLYINANVYIGEPHWTECIAQCDAIINSGKLSLSPNYSDPFRATGVENNKEVIFTIIYDRLFAHGNCLHMFSWGGELSKKFQLEATPWGSGSSCGVPQFVSTYHDNDSRLEDTWLIGPQFEADGTTPIMTVWDYKDNPRQLDYKNTLQSGHYQWEDEGYRMFKFEVIPGTNGQLATDFPLHRYSEILLMKAECLLRSNQAGAGALVSQVRARAFKDNAAAAAVTDEELKADSAVQYGVWDMNAITKPDATAAIPFGRLLDEYGWEFAWEMHRRRDMIRFDAFTRKQWLSKENTDAYRTVFPIPQSALTANANLVQNPDYASSAAPAAK